jgi:hypothetical protein
MTPRAGFLELGHFQRPRACPVRSKIFIVLALLSFWANTTAQAADQHVSSGPKPLDLHVQVKGFGRASAADILAVLQSAADQIWRYCPETELGGIDIYYRADHPQTGFKRTVSGRIEIGLSARDTRWAQYSFQFAHEFGHALANFSKDRQRSVRYPRHANLWLEESLCETASLFALSGMSRSWRIAPPYPVWRDYAPWLNDYVEQRLALSAYRLPAGTPFATWFRKNEPLLRENSEMHEQNTIIARELLPIFEAEPWGWEAVTFLNRGLLDPQESLRRRFAEWRSHCPRKFRPFVSKLAALFAVKLV